MTTTYPRYPGDYVGTYILGQSRALARIGCKIHIIAPHDPTANTWSEERGDAIHVHRFNYWWPHRWQHLCYRAGIPENFRRNRLVAIQLPTLLAAFVRRAVPLVSRCDIVHGHWTFAGMAALIAGRLTGKPVVITMHGAEVLSKMLQSANRYLAAQADGLVVNSSFTRDALRGYTPTADPLVVPFGVNPEKIAPPNFDRGAFRRAAGLTENTLVILAVGRLVERKGFHILIDAVSKLSASHSFHVLICGTGPERDALQAQAIAQGLGERIQLLGFVDDLDLARWYAAADVFVLPAITDSTGDTEGLGVVLLEAIMNGTPVIASHVGGITDIVRNNETGLLVAPGDADDLAAQINMLVLDPQLRDRLCATARHHVENVFSWEAIAHQLYSYYEALSGESS